MRSTSFNSRWLTSRPEPAETKFSDTFQALSAKALKNSQASFLELAKATFAKDQEKAKGASTARQIEAAIRSEMSKVRRRMTDRYQMEF